MKERGYTAGTKEGKEEKNKKIRHEKKNRNGAGAGKQSRPKGANTFSKRKKGDKLKWTKRVQKKMRTSAKSKRTIAQTFPQGRQLHNNLFWKKKERGESGAKRKWTTTRKTRKACPNCGTTSAS